MKRFDRVTAYLGWMAPAGIVLGLICLCCMAALDERIQLLLPGGAPWIVYPSPANGEMISAFNLPADFHRRFELREKPSKAVLQARCFKRGEILLNGHVVCSTDERKWKRAANVDVASWLRAGTNDLEALVTSATGPPALSASLIMGGAKIQTDEAWNVSYAGGLRLPARVAGAISAPEGGRGLFDTELTATALRRVWPIECIFVAVASLSVWFFREKSRPMAILLIAAAAWFVLVIHNAGAMPACFGFDARAHLAYVKYIADHGSLPAPNQGWEMWQGPLYYLAAARLLKTVGCAVFSSAGLEALRGLNIAVGLANAALVYAALGLVFPGQRVKQMAGAVLATYAPWHLALLHYPSNEALSGMLGTATLFLCLKCLQAKDPSPGWHAALGCAFGAACLAKVSVAALGPVVFAALAARQITREQQRLSVWAQTLGFTMALTLIVCGWRYARLWEQFGTPFAGNWMPALAKPWWQQPGILTPGYFATFGRALVGPFFAGYDSFWDGLYSTAWGDGLLGGWIGSVGGPPWNYDLMTVGYVLALAPSFLLISGAVLGLARFVRQPRLEWFVLLGAAGTFVSALVWMTLRLPTAAQAKAFYALPALLPICALTIGYEFWRERSRGVAWAALVLAGAWLMNDFASFWIRPGAPQTHLAIALANCEQRIIDPLPDLQEALAADPHNATAELRAALLERAAGHMDAYAAEVKTIFAEHPDDAEICALEAEALARADQWPAALALAERATRLAPDDYAVALTWLRFARRQHRDADVVSAGEIVLRDRPAELEAHEAMEEALARVGQTNAAAMHAAIVAEQRR